MRFNLRKKKDKYIKIINIDKKKGRKAALLKFNLLQLT